MWCGQRNPFRVLAPARSRTLEHAPARAMGSPHAASYIAADRPAILGRALALPELSGPPEVLSVRDLSVGREAASARLVPQSLRTRCSTRGVAARTSSSRNRLLVQSSSPALVPPYWLGDPTLPSAVSSAVWFSHRGLRWEQLSSRSCPLFEFRLPPESCPAGPSRLAVTCRLLSRTSLPYSTSGIAGPLLTGFACPLRSAFRVWLPS